MRDAQCQTSRRTDRSFFVAGLAEPYLLACDEDPEREDSSIIIAIPSIKLPTLVSGELRCAVQTFLYS